MFRKVIKIRAEDSPNVRFARAQEQAGQEPTNEEIVPGVLTWQEYQRRRLIWDAIRQCIGLDAEFYKGEQVLLYPPDWLNLAEERARNLRGKGRHAKAIGIDPAEGGDSSAWSIIDELGLIKQICMKTPDTNVIPTKTLELMNQYHVPANKVAFDRGGGGKQHADRLRAMGHKVQTVAFGESVVPELKRGKRKFEERAEQKEEAYVYKNRRCQMYGILREWLDPLGEHLFAIPEEYSELRSELAPFPYMLDDEGRLILPPKTSRRDDPNEVTLVKLIGHSPDRADSLVLALYIMTQKRSRSRAGAI